jgi:UDPglucose--hexose-1-phosphate uridylyltransferase
MSELRRDPITGRYVIVAPERLLSRAAFERPHPVAATDGDMCPFCEGQEHVAGREILSWRPPGSAHDGPGWLLRVVANREPALKIESHLGEASPTLFQWFGGLGAHEVIIESPKHGATLGSMSVEEVERVLWAWRERIRDLRRDFRFESFLIVKNVGAAAGATFDHPHSQLLALPVVPQHLEDELAGARGHFERTGTCVYCDIAGQERAAHTRVIAADDRAIAFTPFASRVPFESWIVPREHCGPLEQVTDVSLRAVAERLQDVARRLDRVLTSPPFTLLLHTAPVEDSVPKAFQPPHPVLPFPDTPEDAPASGESEPGPDSASTSPDVRGHSVHGYFHWHLELIPRLLPVPGLAWDGGIHINPVSPEEAAQSLRDAKV